MLKSPDHRRFRFEDYRLDVADRRLSRNGAPLDLSGRYFDVLCLMVTNAGELVTKERFMDEVWRGVPVTDEALTQAIRSIRKLLSDDPSAPHYIKTVPKHGYRFIAEVEAEVPGTAVHPRKLEASAKTDEPLFGAALRAGAGALGGGVAGLIGGAIYGAIVADKVAGSGGGSASAFLVVTCVTILVALVGAAGVSSGIAAASVLGKSSGPWLPVGGAIGGMIIGAIGRVLGLDAFALILGETPTEITGAFEGAILGGGVGLGLWLALSLVRTGIVRASLAAGTIGGMAGAAITALGGRLMAGSLNALAARFPASRLDLSAIGSAVGGAGFDKTANIVTGALEGFLFAACIAAAFLAAGRSLEKSGRPDRLGT
ncbi:winged helix-turn-helix domain-containing protein [Qipengyuania atrilutea]|uniref:Winged helix-turn-helix domain-containing protein n=1 Tax=Qipengyuania atrilutea TaxID=2744473 RepID=A0A850H6K0_9SPHN|nr:winged helix-turn-helix domain-containing protein [Actirhodobacter atriluteus]NVD45782.1 winged helix-turn-helix domain-containing protein [Actirhodobacter atriluteus]